MYFLSSPPPVPEHESALHVRILMLYLECLCVFVDGMSRALSILHVRALVFNSHLDRLSNIRCIRAVHNVKSDYVAEK